MALQEQVLPLSFASGLDTKTDAKQIDAGKLLDLQNGIFISPKEIRKRNGYASLTQAVSNSPFPIVSGNSLGTLNNVLTLADNDAIFAYLPTINAWQYSGVKPNTRVSVSNLTGSAGTGAYPAECGPLNNQKLTAFVSTQDPLSFQTVVSDYVTNTITLTETVSTGSTISFIQTLVFNGNFVIAVISASEVKIYATNGTNLVPALVASFNLTTNTGVFDQLFSVVANATNLFFLYVSSTDVLSLSKLDTTYTLVNTFSFPTIASCLGMDLVLDPVNNELIAGYSSINNFTYYTLDLTLTPIVNFSKAVTNISAISICPESTYANLGVVAEVLTSDPVNDYLTKTFVLIGYRTSPISHDAATYAYNTRLFSKLLYLSGFFYYAVASFDPVQSVAFLIRFSALVGPALDSIEGISTVGKFGLETFYSGTQKVGLVAWNQQMLPYLSASHATIINGTISAIYQVAELSLTLDQKLTNVTLGNNINYVGGTTSLYDGEGVAEAGFNLFPTVLTIANGGTGFNFSYVALYTWIDFQGNLHRSAPSIAVSFTETADISSSNPIVVSVKGLGISELYKINNVNIEVYRTSGSSGGGSVYYLIGTAINNPLGLVTITDTTNSTQLTGNQQLYTTGGEVENIAPPATNLMTSFKNRIVLVDAENPLQWWYSKQIIQGFPAEFSDVLTQNIDQKGGPITALSTMDDKLVFFKQANLWYVIGDGPSPNGQNNDFTYPQIISSDTGCTNQNSIVLTPGGLFFQSPKGIYLLGRDLSLNYVGSPVERYNSSNVTSAQMIAGTNQIRFSLDSGIVLVYDYFMQQWSVFTNIASNDTIIYKGNYTYLTSTGVVNIETPSAYVDPSNTTIALSLTTGWLSIAGLQGFERVKQFLILGEAESSTTLSVKLAYDFEPKVTQTDSISVTSKIPMQYRIFMARQKCQAIQITLSDAPTTPTEGLRLSALALNIAVKKGPYKKSAALTYG